MHSIKLAALQFHRTFALLTHWWRLIVEPRGRGRLMGMQAQRWRVRYADGHLSAAMAYDTAHDYKSIFGGEVERA